MKLCDSSVLVDIDRGGIDEKVEGLDAEGTHAISAVTVTELRLGLAIQYDRGTEAYQIARDGIDRLLARFQLHPISQPVATTAATIMADLRDGGQPIGDLHDIYIGATAIHRSLPVLTSNVTHFERMAGVEVVDWDSY